MFLTLLLVMSVFTFGDGTNSSVQKAQELIRSKRFMTKSGLQELKTISSSLDEKTRMDLFYANKKIPALGFLSFVVPSLGNWIVGDTTGGVVTLVLFGSGIGVAYFGAYMMVNSIHYTKDEYGYSYPTVDSSQYSTGYLFYLVGLGLMIGGDIYSAFSAFSYGRRFNSSLQEGLSLSTVYNYPLDQRINSVTEKRGLFNRREEIVNFDLVAIRF